MKKFLLFISCLCFNIGIVYAAPSASISVNKSRVENGSSVSATVTVKSTAAWNIRISSSELLVDAHRSLQMQRVMGRIQLSLLQLLVRRLV